MKKTFKIILIFVILLLTLGMNQVWANYFEIEVNYNGKKLEMTSEDPDMIYNIKNFSPGDSEISYLIIKNTGSKPVEMYIKNIEMLQDANLLNTLNIKITNQEEIIFDGSYSKINQIDLKTINAGQVNTYKIETIFSKNAGNEYQNKEYNIKFNFEARGNEIEEAPNNTVPNNNIPNGNVQKQETPKKQDTTVADKVLPKTGKESLTWVLVIIFIIILITIIRYIDIKYEKHIGKILLNIITIITAIFLLIIICSVIKGKITGEEVYIMGYKPYIVKTGSMEPEIETNGFIIVKKGKFDEVQIGDIINYKIDDANLSICHRVVSKNDDGTFTTKGDNNKVEDSWKIGEKEYVGTVKYKINWLGKVITNIQNNFKYYSIIALIIIIAVIVLVIILKTKGGIKN